MKKKYIIITGVAGMIGSELLEQIIHNPSLLPIPKKHFNVKEYHRGNNGKLIIHIQDISFVI